MPECMLSRWCFSWLIGLVFLRPLAGLAQMPAVPADENYQRCLAEGKSFIADRHYSEAVSALNRCKELSSQDSRAYFFSGVALAEAGHLSAAAAELNEAVRLNPAPPEYILAQANVLAELGHKSEAVKALARFENPEEATRLTTESL